MTTSSWSCPIEFWPFLGQHADDGDRDLLDPDHLVQRIHIAEQLARHGLADDGHLGRALDVGGVESPPVRQRPFARFEVVVGRAEDRRAPVGVARHHLRAGARARRGHLHLGHLPGNRQRVFLGQALAGLRAQAHAAGRDAAGDHQHDVGAQALHLLLHALGGAAAHGDHGDDRRHADDDAQHGEDGAQRVGGQRAQGNAEGGEEIHGAAP
jgi:hypothetical protein